MTLSSPTAEALKPGFADPVFDAQATFRAALDALAYPGRVRETGVALDAPAPLSPASAALLLALADFDTPVWLDAAADTEAVRSYIRFHCGAPVTARPEEARFAIIADAANFSGFAAFSIGEDRYPDRSATLLIEVPSLTGGPAATWAGPGIDGSIGTAIDGLPQAFRDGWADNHALYPLGVDVIFTSGTALTGLPRSIKVEG